MLEEGTCRHAPRASVLEYCLRMGTAYFAWFFEGVYQSDQEGRAAQRVAMAASNKEELFLPRPLDADTR